jgi:outer membrane lipase/esterase
MRHIFLAAAAAAFLASPAAASPLSAQFTGLAVFGDSLSDDGNLGAPLTASPPFFAAPPSPPYFDGQFSNGPVALDILAGSFDADRVSNYANGFARTTDSTPVNDLPEQLATFGLEAPDLGSRPLVSLWFGANDIFAALETLAVDLAAIPGLAASPEEATALQGAAFARAGATAQSAAQNVVAAIAGLSATGLDDFLVFNLPDLGRTPASLAAGAEAILAATTLSTAFNAVLSAGLDAIEGPGTRIIRIDVPSEFSRIAAASSPLGLTNVTDRCFTPDPFAVCDDPATYLFWDSVHPTAVVHAELARVVEAAVIPLPGTLPLLAGAFVVAGLVRRRVA